MVSDKRIRLQDTFGDVQDRVFEVLLREPTGTGRHTMSASGGYLTRRESADYLRISLRTFDGLVSKGFLPKFRVSKGRVVFRCTDLDAYVQGNKVEDEEDSSAATVARTILGK